MRNNSNGRMSMLFLSTRPYKVLRMISVISYIIGPECRFVPRWDLGDLIFWSLRSPAAVSRWSCGFIALKAINYFPRLFVAKYIDVVSGSYLMRYPYTDHHSLPDAMVNGIKGTSSIITIIRAFINLLKVEKCAISNKPYLGIATEGNF